jgi:hypothetical protein
VISILLLSVLEPSFYGTEEFKVLSSTSPSCLCKAFYKLCTFMANAAHDYEVYTRWIQKSNAQHRKYLIKQ